MDHNAPHIQLTAPQPRAPHLSDSLIPALNRAPHLPDSLIAPLNRAPHLPDSLIAARNRVPHLRDGSIVAKVGHRASDPLSSPRRTFLLTLAILLTTALPAQAQWDTQESHTTASLRGIANVGGGVAWASGTEGTVLRTEDGGYLWQTCTTPPGAEKLDFRGIQAFDENTAIVMSSGKGDLSRLYKTTDGCRTWKLLFTNPDKEGFWDAMQFDGKMDGMILGDPVDSEFVVFITQDSGLTWHRQKPTGLQTTSSQEAIFAASNSSLVVWSGLAHRFFVTGGVSGAHFIECHGGLHVGGRPENTECLKSSQSIPLMSGTSSSGAFSLGMISTASIAVGGDYQRPNDAQKTAAYTTDAGETWRPAKTPPNGYRSAVAYDPTTKTWITVGPNGTDISRDDGRNWSPLKPTAAEPQDADKNWNALSLPFVVGPKGRIGKLRTTAIPTAASSKDKKE